MTLLRNMAVGAAAVSEAISSVALLRGAAAPAFILHVVASACAAASLHRRLIGGSAASAFGLLLTAALFVPLFGVLGTLAVALATPAQARADDPECVLTRIPRPPQAVDAASVASADPADRPARIRQLGALRDRSDAQAVGRLRRALEDPDEDVRLLAHALLESKNRAAWREIEASSAALVAADEDSRGRLHRRLAAEYWEIAWTGLAEGECLDHALTSARRHAMAALEQDPGCASLQLLLGRIELRLGSPDAAEAALTRAVALGLPRDVAAPYLAEIAFLRRRFDVVRAQFASCREGSSGGAAAQVRRYWA